MASVEGPTLAEALLSDQVPPAEAGLLLADLHDRLHALGPPQGDLPMGHLDLHPLNVLMSPDGPVVIDWSNARPVEPAFIPIPCPTSGSGPSGDRGKQEPGG